MRYYATVLVIGLAAVIAGLVWQYAGNPASPGPVPVDAGQKDAGSGGTGPAFRHAAEQTCVDDVSIENILVVDVGNWYELLDPPDYAADSTANIAIFYDAVNHSCQDVTAKVTMRGSVSNAVIDNADVANDACTDECTIAAGDTHWGNFAWDLSDHPATNDEAVVVTITITGPTGFSDTNAANNSVTSTDTINILAEAPEPTPTPTPTPTPEPVTDIAVTAVTVSSPVFIGETANVEVTVANQGNTTVAGAALALYVKDSTESVATGAAASMAEGESETVSLAWDTTGNAPGTYPLRVVASVTGDSNSDNDSGTASVVLRKPQVDVGFTGSISAPQIAVIGDTITLKATIVNRGETAVAAPLGLYVGGASVPAASATTEKIAPEGSLTASIDWDTSSYSSPRDYQLQLKVAVPGDASAGDNTLSAAVKLFYSAFDPSDDGTPDACADDVRVNVSSITDNNYPLLSPPDYKTEEGDRLLIAYEVYNYSCESDVTAVVKLTGAATTIAIDEDEDALCINGCRIPAGGLIETIARWHLSEYRAVTGEKVKAVVETTQPADFTDVNQDNNTYISQQGINVSYPDDIKVGVGDDRKGEIKSDLAAPAFGAVSVRLVDASASPPVAYNAESVPLRITVANDGAHTEPVVAIISVVSSDNSEPETLSPRGLKVPAMQSSDFTLQLPAARLQVGVNNIAVAISAVNDAPSDNAATLTITREPAPLDVAITGITASPSGSAMQGQQVEIRVAVRNDGPYSVPIPVQLTFPSASKSPETKSPRVKSGESGVAVFTWQTRNYAVGAYTLRANITATNNITSGDTSRTLQYRITPLVLSATITDIATAPGSPVVGEAVTITVSVRNDGPIYGALPVTLHFPAEGKRPETRRPRIQVGATGTAVFTWRTGNYQPGTHTFRVQAGENISRLFHIDLLAPAADFEVTALHRSDPDPSRPVVKGDRVSFTAKVINYGPYAGRSRLTLRSLSASQDIDRQTISLAPRQSGAVTFTWKTLRYAIGEHRLQVISDAAYDDHSGNDASNIMSLTILTNRDITIGAGSAPPERLLASPMAAPGVDTAPHIVRYIIKDVAIAPDNPVAGHPVSITVTVHNAGTHPANVPITLHFPSEDKQPETRSPRIAPGQDVSAVFTWRTGHYRPGTYTFRVQAGEDATRSFHIDLLVPAADFAVTALHRSDPDPSRPVVKGDWVALTAGVANHGPYAGRSRLTLRNLSAAQDISRQTINLEPEQSGEVAFTWKTLRYAIGEHRLQVISDAEYDDYPGNDVSNIIPITILTDRDVTIGAGSAAPERLLASPMAAPDVDTAPHIVRYIIKDVLITPDNPVAGHPVSITVTVHNAGTHPANVPITLHFPAENKQPETRRPRIAPGQDASAPFTWRTGRYHYGNHTFRVEVPTVEPEVFTAALLPPTVDFVLIDLYPISAGYPIVKGDWVEVAVFIRNDGPNRGRAKVILRDLTEKRTMYSAGASLAPDETRIVAFTWKTLRYALGEHHLQAVTEASHDINGDNDHSNVVTATIRTNRDITIGIGDTTPEQLAAAMSAPRILTPAQ